LVIDLKDSHFAKALAVIRQRFPAAEIKELPVAGAADLFFKLRGLRQERFSAVIILSLHPAAVFFVNLNFRCYFLLYNRFGQWFLIRRKTLYEFLAGRSGADKPELDWAVPAGRLSAVRIAAGLLLFPAVAIRNGLKAIRLLAYLLVNTLYFSFRRLYFSIIPAKE
jgi:hypothetical protein